MAAISSGSIITRDGTALALTERGSGDALAFVHGGVSDQRTWTDQLDFFAASHHAIAYSRRYAVPNAPITDDADDPMQVHVEDLADLIKNRATGPAHIVGHSWGGFIALELAIQMPELCKSLVLIEPPVLTLLIDFPPNPAKLFKLFLKSPSSALALVKLAVGAMVPAEKAFRRGDDRAAVEAFGAGVLGKKRFHALSKQRYEQVWANRAPDRAQILGIGFPPLTEKEVASVNQPVLLLSGTESPTIFNRLNQHLIELLPDASHQIIPNASHLLHEDAPEAFQTAVATFLRTRTSERDGSLSD
ncbi:alpha/beta hydrolase [Devosia rhodophyticola]|uniref:Alpha/beta hydrolase n=1 Tax=Devosia rhodophyticola TaxID=3026423 RepID=A0ABY7Z096_9HYPH|nr:alpha/beta hydrolase [Devosia rhodophyticola]WDR06450.1 alpha/beta hydrolase [Devosia rhodophyticola]